MKLRRFGVVSSPDRRLAAWQRDCLDALDAVGCGRPAWAAPSAGDPAPSRLWRAYLNRGGTAPIAPPGWWDQAWRNTDRSPVDFIVCFGSPPAGMDRPPFGLWRFDVDDGLPIGWRAATGGAPTIHAALVADVANEHVELQQGWLPLSLNYRATERRLHEVLAGWPARAVAEIESGGWKTLKRVGARKRTSDYPSDWELARTLCAMPIRRAWRRWREAARYDTWNISVSTLGAPLTDVRQLASLGQDVRWLPPRPPLYYLADPFPYRQNG